MRWRSGVLVAGLTGGVLVARTLIPAGGAGWALPVVLLVLAGLVVADRFRPTLALLGAAALTTAVIWFAVPLAALAYRHGRRSDPRPAVLAGGAAGAAALAVVVHGATAGPMVVVLAVVVLGGVVPWLAGRQRRQRRQLVHAGWVRAAMLEHRQQVLAEQVRLRERARIAEEMHDSLGHEISLMALRAAALQVAPGLDERHRQAADQLREDAAAVTRRLHDIIGVLRDPDQPAPTRPPSVRIPEPTAIRPPGGSISVPAPGRPPGASLAEPALGRAPGESIAELVDRARAAGMAVHRTGASGAAPEPVDRVARQVVREALTNAAKHAPGAPVEVAVTRSATTTTVRVRNGPPARVPPADPPGARLGLDGLRTRVAVAGGTVHAGPAGDGFEVVAQLPHEAPAEESGTAPDPAPHPTARWNRPAPGPRPDRDRGLTEALLLPACALVAMAVGDYLHTTAGAVFDRAAFDSLPIGASQARVDELAPPRQVPGRPAREPAVPAGGSCRYYSDGSFLVRDHAYRLCFRDGVLVARDRLGAPASSD